MAVLGRCYVGELDCWTFLAILAFLGFTVTILLVATLHYYVIRSRSARDAHENDSPTSKPPAITEKDVSMFERMGAWTETKLERMFNQWGRICTRHPIIVFCGGLLVSVICTCGLYFMQMTTDPVKLWSAPNSRARVEKDYFDSKFGRVKTLWLVGEFGPVSRSGWVSQGPASRDPHWGSKVESQQSKGLGI